MIIGAGHLNSSTDVIHSNDYRVWVISSHPLILYTLMIIGAGHLLLSTDIIHSNDYRGWSSLVIH